MTALLSLMAVASSFRCDAPRRLGQRPNHHLVTWLYESQWHYSIRLVHDVLLDGARFYPTAVCLLYPPLGEACLYCKIKLWLDRVHYCNLVLAAVKGAKELWVVITHEPPSLQLCGSRI